MKMGNGCDCSCGGCAVRTKAVWHVFPGFVPVSLFYQDTFTSTDALDVYYGVLLPFENNLNQFGSGDSVEGLFGDVNYPKRYTHARVVHTYAGQAAPSGHSAPIPFTHTMDFWIDPRTGLMKKVTWAVSNGGDSYSWEIADDGTITETGSHANPVPPTVVSIYHVVDNTYGGETQTVTLTENTVAFTATSHVDIVLDGDVDQTTFEITESISIVLDEAVAPEDAIVLAEAIFDGIGYGATLVIDGVSSVFGWGELVTGFYARYNSGGIYPLQLFYTRHTGFYPLQCLPGVARLVFGDMPIAPGFLESLGLVSFASKSVAYVAGAQLMIPAIGHYCFISFEYEPMEAATDDAPYATGHDTQATGLFDKVLDMNGVGLTTEFRPEDMLFDYGYAKLFIDCEGGLPCESDETLCF